MKNSSISLVAQHQHGDSRRATAEEIIAAARDHMFRRVRRGTQLNSPKAIRDYLSLKLGKMFQGTIDGAWVHPREVMKESLK